VTADSRWGIRTEVLEGQKLTSAYVQAVKAKSEKIRYVKVESQVFARVLVMFWEVVEGVEVREIKAHTFMG
jgi:copper(I)-binding protein